MAESFSSPSQIGTPVATARFWSTGLAPRSGNWDFITQAYNANGLGLQSEWVVVNIFSGTVALMSGGWGVASNTNYNITSTNYPVDTNQLLCANGRIIFPQFYTYIAYYDPADGRVHELPRIHDPINDVGTPAASGNAIIYRMEFDRDGVLYGGTQAGQGKRPMVFKMSTASLSATVLGHVGNTGSLTYAYYLAADPPWLYVAVGQDPWELCALHTGTLSSSILARPYTHIEFTRRNEGWTASLTNASGSVSWWCIDGALHTYSAGYDPQSLPFAPRNVTPAGPVTSSNRPQIDYSRGIGQFLWRPTGSVGPWTKITYQVNRTASIDIESLGALPNGTLLGSTVQYGGFYEFKTGTLHRHGAWHGVSGMVMCNSGTDTYLCGYPNGALFRYVCSDPWAPPDNPVNLGSFTVSGVKYPYFLELSENGRLYMGGRRERDGQGGAVGWYHPGDDQFDGHHDNLNFYTPRGFLLIDSLDTIVFSGEITADPDFPGQTPTSASLIFYDRDLVETARKTVDTGLLDTGKLFRTSNPSIIVGLVESPKKIYRYNIQTGQLLASGTFTGSLGASTQRSTDMSIWAVIGGTLVSINPVTLEFTNVRNVSAL